MEGASLVLHFVLNQLDVLLGIARRPVELVQQDLGLYPFEGPRQVHVLHVRVLNLFQFLTELSSDYAPLVISLDFLQMDE